MLFLLKINSEFKISTLGVECESYAYECAIMAIDKINNYLIRHMPILRSTIGNGI